MPLLSHLVAEARMLLGESMLHVSNYRLDPIRHEIEYLQHWIKKNPGVFAGAFIVGSWAVQHPDRLPDRDGAGTSDIDLMLPEVSGFGTMDLAISRAVQLEKDWPKKFHRKLQVNVAPVTGSASRVQIA